MQKRSPIPLVLAIAAIAYVLSGGGGLPDILPGPVDSPFPAEGKWLLVTYESETEPYTKSVGNAESVRNFPGLNRRVLDDDMTPTESPWIEALAWANERAGGNPYYVARHGHKASEGPLRGSASQQLATLNAALEGID